MPEHETSAVAERELVGALALYETPDDAIAGAELARRNGFTRLDVASPYPIHGIDGILGAKPSRLGVLALVAGLTGTAVGKLAQWWMSSVNYPLNIGGKPLFSLPAFLPVTFEMMVLSASVATVIGLLFVILRLPVWGNALESSKYARRLTGDGFAVVVDARDPLFSVKSVEGLIRGENATAVELLYREPLPGYYRERVASPTFILLLTALALCTAAATHSVWRWAGEFPPFDFMMRQAKLTPQHATDLLPNGRTMQMPVAGTIARGDMPYLFAGDPEGAAAGLVNPVPVTAENLATGQHRYRVFCQPCHGPRAEGNMSLTAKFPRPPSLHSTKVREWPDGRVFHVLTEGQNSMPSYAAQISKEDRWRVVHYVRALQRSRNAPDGDMP